MEVVVDVDGSFRFEFQPKEAKLGLQLLSTLQPKNEEALMAIVKAMDTIADRNPTQFGTPLQ